MITLKLKNVYRHRLVVTGRVVVLIYTRGFVLYLLYFSCVYTVTVNRDFSCIFCCFHFYIALKFISLSSCNCHFFYLYVSVASWNSHNILSLQVKELLKSINVPFNAMELDIIGRPSPSPAFNKYFCIFKHIIQLYKIQTAAKEQRC